MTSFGYAGIYLLVGAFFGIVVCFVSYKNRSYKDTWGSLFLEVVVLGLIWPVTLCLLVHVMLDKPLPERRKE